MACGMASHFWSATEVVVVVVLVVEVVVVGVGFRGSKIQNDQGYRIMHQKCVKIPLVVFDGSSKNEERRMLADVGERVLVDGFLSRSVLGCSIGLEISDATTTTTYTTGRLLPTRKREKKKIVRNQDSFFPTSASRASYVPRIDGNKRNIIPTEARISIYRYSLLHGQRYGTQ